MEEQRGGRAEPMAEDVDRDELVRRAAAAAAAAAGAEAYQPPAERERWRRIALAVIEGAGG